VGWQLLVILYYTQLTENEMANNIEEGSIEFDVRLDNERLQADAKTAREAIRKIGDSSVVEGARMDNAFKQIGGTVAAAFSIQQAAMFVKEIVRVRGEIESLEISFETLLGNKGKAAALMSEIKTFASSTPMQMGDLAKGAQTLLGFNVEAEKVMPILRQIGDISMGDAQKFNSLTLAFSQMTSTGKLMGQDLLQMINVGFNPLVTLSEKTGKSIAQLKDDMSAGAISAEMVADAFASAAGEGGKFHGMLEKQSHGIQGSLSNLTGAIDDMFNDLGNESSGVITAVVGGATDIVHNYKGVGEALAVIIGLYGTYKAAVMATAAIDGAVATTGAMAATAAVEAEIAAYAKLLPAKQASAHEDVIAAVAAGQLTQVKADEIIAIRAEVQAKLNDLTITRQQAIAELASAEATQRANAQRLISANALVATRQAELATAQVMGSARQTEIAQNNLLAAQEEKRLAAAALTASKNQVAIVQSKAKTALKAEETLAENINTISQTKNTAATGILVAVKTRLMAVMAKLKAAMLANPYALALAGVAALGYGMYKLITYQTDAEKAQAELNKTIKEGEQSMASERIQIDILFNRLKNAKQGTEDWDSARKTIMSKYGEYLKHLGDEKTALDDIAAAYNAVKEGAEVSARERMKESAAKTAADTLAKKESEAYDNILERLRKNIKGTDKEIKAQEYMVKLKPVLEGKGKFTEELNNELSNLTPGDGYVRLQLYKLGAVRDAVDKTMSDLEKKYGRTGGDSEEYKTKSWEELYELDTAMDTVAKNEIKRREDLEKSGKVTAASYGDVYKKAKEEWMTAKKELLAIEKDKDKFTQEQYEKAKTRESAAKKTYSDLGGETTAKKTSEKTSKPKDYTEQREKDAQDLERFYTEMEFDVRQAQIDAMNEGLEKALSQNELNFDKEMEQIRRQKDEELKLIKESQKTIWESQNPNWEKKGLKFDFDSFVKGSMTNIGDKMNETFGNGNVDLLARPMIDAAKLVEKGWEDAGEGIATVFSSQLGILDEAGKNVEILVTPILPDGTVLSPEELESYIYDDLQGAKDILSADTKGIIISVGVDESGDAGEYLHQLQEEYYELKQLMDNPIDESQYDALETGAKAKLGSNNKEAYENELKEYEDFAQQYLNKVKEFENIRKNLEKQGASEDSLKKVKDMQDSMLAELDEAMNIKNETFVTFVEGLVDLGVSEIDAQLKKLQEELEKAKNELENANKTGDGAKVKQAQAKVTVVEKRINELTDGQKEVKADPAKKWNDTLSVMEDVKSLTNDIADNFEGLDESTKAVLDAAMNIATGVINMIIGITTLATGAAATTTVVAETSATAIKSVEKASVILAIISAAIQVIKAIASILKTVFSKDKKREKEIQGLQGQVDALKESYDKLGDAIDKAYSANAAKLIEAQAENMKQQKKLMEQQIRLEEEKKKTDDAKVQQYRDAIKEIDKELSKTNDNVVSAIIGEDIKSAINDFAEAYMDAWAAGEDKAASMKEVVRKMIKSAVTELVKSRMSGEVEAFMNYLAESMEDGILSVAEQNTLDALESAINSKMNDLDASFDKYIKDEESGREASSKGFGAMTQDSADELNGRFTALQALVAAINADVKSLVNNSAVALKHLAGIESNTQSLSRLAAIETDIGSIKSGINDMNLKGLILRK
jgi:tape measure domain-containing protein